MCAYLNDIVFSNVIDVYPAICKIFLKNVYS